MKVINIRLYVEDGYNEERAINDLGMNVDAVVAGVALVSDQSTDTAVVDVDTARYFLAGGGEDESRTVDAAYAALGIEDPS